MQSRQPTPKQSGFSAIEALLVVFVIAALTVTGLVVYPHHKPSSAKNSAATSQTQTSTQPQNMVTTQPAPDPYAGWQTYSNPNVSLKYPSGWTVSIGRGPYDRAAATSPAFTSGAVETADNPGAQITMILRLDTDSATVDCASAPCQVSAVTPISNPQLPGAVLALVNQVSGNGTKYTEYVVTSSTTKVGDTSVSPVKAGSSNLYVFGQAYYTPKDGTLTIAARVTDAAGFQADSHFKDLVGLINSIKFN